MNGIAFPSAPGGGENSAGVALTLEINTNHRYKAEEMGVLEFRVRNQSPQAIPVLNLVIDCPCQRSGKKSAILKTVLPSSEKRPSFQFEPARGGEALLEVEIMLECDDRSLRVYRGQTSVSISSKDESRSSPTSFNLNFHDIQKFMGNDLSGLLSIAGKEISEDRLRERMERKDPFWMRVDLDFDEHESARRSQAVRRIISLPGGQIPMRTGRARLEAVAADAPHRVFIYSTPQIRFGRHAQKNDVVLRFLPDFYQDERSRTISAEQFLARYSEGEYRLALAQDGRAPLSFNGQIVKYGEQISLSSGSEIKIGTHEFALKITSTPRTEDPNWMRTWNEILRSEPAEDPFKTSSLDALSFTRPANGQEEEYLWLVRKTQIGWETGAGAGIRLNQPSNPRARLSFWNGRYYLEPLQPGIEIGVAGHMLQVGDIVCLGPETDVVFGPHQYHWTLIGHERSFS